MTQQILFISHAATRTGAPILLLNFLRWFKENTDIPFRIILYNQGELESEFRKLAPTFLFELKPKPGYYHRLKRFLGLVEKPTVRLKKWLGKTDIGLIYSNTITNSKILDALSFLNCPVISHVHELEYIIHYFGLDDFEKTKQLTTHFIACANAVKKNLIDHHQISPQDISVIHEFIPTSLIPLNSPNQKLLEKELKLSDQAFIVGASGNICWRKGIDLFIQLAYNVKYKAEDAQIKFVWVGSKGDEIEYFGLLQDILKAGLQDYVYLIGSKPNPLDYFAGFNVFVLTSREDPYPLVCLENALLSKPIICFEKSGGEPEFVENDCGFVVPYLDLDAMSDRIIQLYESPQLREKLGQNAKNKVCDRHDLNRIAPKILEVIKQYFKN